MELQGSVKYFTLSAASDVKDQIENYPSNVTRVVLNNLTPNTEYTILVTITVHGGGAINNEPVITSTLDGGKNAFMMKP